MPKFRNVPSFYEGTLYDSKWEATVAERLALEERAGDLRDLKNHVEHIEACRFVLQEAFRDKFKKAHQKITYEADFCYWRGTQFCVADAKGVKTEAFKIKYKLFCKRYPEIKFEIFTDDRPRGRGRRRSKRA